MGVVVSVTKHFIQQIVNCPGDSRWCAKSDQPRIGALVRTYFKACDRFSHSASKRTVKEDVHVKFSFPSFFLADAKVYQEVAIFVYPYANFVFGEHVHGKDLTRVCATVMEKLWTVSRLSARH